MSDKERKSKGLLGDLPLEVLLDDVLAFVPANDLLRLGCVNRFFNNLCNDNTLWKRKLLEDFNFSGEGTARTSGYKFIYRGLSKPKVFVWGEKANGRLGLEAPPRTITVGVPYPVQVRLPESRVVSLVAGGMSFHALDSEGSVYVWGTLDGSAFSGPNAGFSEPSKQATTPHKLNLPAPIRSLSCGRLHSSCLDRNNKIWTFTNWGRPFYLSSPILSDPEYAPKQIECGWMFSSLLTKSGDVFIWWPFSGEMGTLVQQKMRQMDNDGDKKVHAEGQKIPCITWDLDLAPTRLPSIPSLPSLPDNGDHEKEQKTQLIQIAAFDNHIVGLTNYGHVLKYGSLHDESGVPHGRWEYLPKFSELQEVVQAPIFSASDGGLNNIAAPKTLKITHISANFEHFVAYSTGSSSIVLLGHVETTSEVQPKIIPELQNKSCISVVIGDYHNAALTSDGKLFTWGAYSSGALGLGDPAHLRPGAPGAFQDDNSYQLALVRRRGNPPAVEKPTEVRFDQTGSPKKRFCFAVTAAGWHTGALVIDLEPGEDEDRQTENTTGSSTPSDAGIGAPFDAMPTVYRFGLAAGLGRRYPPAGGSAS